MGTLKADLEMLGKLSTKLHELGGNVQKVAPARGMGPQAVSVLNSVKAADEITKALIVSTLLPTVTERLNETGDVMANIAQHYKNADENSAGEILTVYNQATGDWTV